MLKTAFKLIIYENSFNINLIFCVFVLLIIHKIWYNIIKKYLLYYV